MGWGDMGTEAEEQGREWIDIVHTPRHIMRGTSGSFGSMELVEHNELVVHDGLHKSIGSLQEA
jgi:hypothetical protein